MVAVSEVAAVAGVVRRGRKTTYFLMVSSQWGSWPWLINSISSSPAAVIVSQPPVPPVPELVVPEY